MSTECSLRVKRSDPSPRANAPPKAVAVLGRSGQDADPSGKRVLTLSAPRRRKRRNEAGTEASLNNPYAVRRRTALLRGRQLRLPWRTASGSRQPYGRQMSAMGKRVWRTPTPTLVPVGRKTDRDLRFSRGRGGARKRWDGSRILGDQAKAAMSRTELAQSKT